MRTRIWGIVSIGIGAVILSAGGLSHADPPGPGALPIHVVSIKTEEADQQADALTSAIKSEVRRLKGWSLGDGDYSLEILALALRCPTPPDASCQLRIADEIKADRYIWGTLDQGAGNQVKGALHMWTRQQGQTEVPLSYSDNLTEAGDDALRQVVRNALQALTGGPPKGSVRLQAGDVNGQVFVDGEPAGAITNGNATIFVPVGEHSVEIRAAGYGPTSGKVEVRPNAEVMLTLTPQTAEAAQDAGTPMNYRKVAGYGALIGGGALAVGGVVSALQVNSVNNDEGFNAYREAMPRGSDICEAAKGGVVPPGAPAGAASPSDVADKCSTASTFQTLQWVFFGLGAVGIGTGTYLLMTETPSDEQGGSAARVQVVPKTGRGTSGVDVRLVF